MQPQVPMQAPQSPPSAGGAKQIVESVHTGLLKLQEMLGNSPAAEKVGMLVEALNQLVDELVGGGAPQQAAPKAPPQGPVGPSDAMGGPKGIPRV